MSRIEVETPISEEAYYHYANNLNNPRLYKQRAEPYQGVSVDWIAGLATPIIEVEHALVQSDGAEFIQILSDNLRDETDNASLDNERLAHALYPDSRSEKLPVVTTDSIIEDILKLRKEGKTQITIGIGGRSGSGKTTIAREVQSYLMTHPELGEPSTLLSTDDYHRGKKYLEETYGAPWINWEDARVYNTAELAVDIHRYRQGEPIRRRFFDFSCEEPQQGDFLDINNFVIIEGIHAGSEDLHTICDRVYQITTPLSVSLGRDLKRLISTNRHEAAFTSPAERLRYILEIGEPTYQEIHKRN